jgi:uncharacterized protein YndB with AHSA1/START domain
MIDIVREIEAVKRGIGRGRIAAGEGRSIRLRRTYDAPIADVWDALTNPERISRWFLPISGDYRLGGRYQFEGNAGGEILACERPHRLRVTCVYGEVTDPADVSEVEGQLTAAGDEATVLELEHTAIVPDDRWDEYGAGRGGGGLGPGAARAGAPPTWRLRGRPDLLAVVRRGPGLRDPEQRGMGRRERDGRSRPDCGGACCREHHRLLRTGPGRRRLTAPRCTRSDTRSGPRCGSIPSARPHDGRSPPPSGRLLPMSLNIKNAETFRLAHELADVTGESVSEAVRKSVQERLERVRGVEGAELVERMLAIGRDCADRLPEQVRSIDHGELLYDDQGLPR